MSVNVLADAQFTLAQVLRPFDGFEAVYQGKSVFAPIVFPGTLDSMAGKRGFSPYLLEGLSVPMGAKVQLWIPQVITSLEGIPAVDYKYLLIWRLRNTGDFARQQKSYHFGKEAFGASDTFLDGSSTAPSPQFVLPAASETVVYQQTEPAGAGPGIGNLRTETIAVISDVAEQLTNAGLPYLPPNAAPDFDNAYPIIPGTNTTPLGAFQQGVIDPRYSDSALSWLFRPYFTVAKGDELLIAVTRNNTPEETLTWDFGSLDFQFSNLYGTNAFAPAGTVSHPPFPDLGVYVFTGSNPS